MLKTNTYGVYYIAFCFKWVLYAGISLATSNALAAKDEMAGLHHQMQHLREQMQQTQELISHKLMYWSNVSWSLKRLTIISKETIPCQSPVYLSLMNITHNQQDFSGRCQVLLPWVDRLPMEMN